MSDVKFACPDCAQHIVCDDAWCGNAIKCPGCGTTFLVPRLAAFIPLSGGKLTMSVPVGSKLATPPPPRTLDVWTQAQWDLHEARVTGEKPGSQWVIWIFVFLPFPVAFLLMAKRAGSDAIFACFIASAIIAGVVAASRRKSGLEMGFSAILYSLGMLCLYAALAVGLLFVGCVFLL